MKQSRSYTIDQVSQLVSISKSDLRNWEKRYGFPRPERTEGGRRVYSENEIKKIKRIKQFLDNGTPPRKLGLIYDSLEENEGAHGEFDESWSSGIREIGEAIYSFDGPSAQKKLGDLAVSMSPEDLFHRVYRPLVEKVRDDFVASTVSTASSLYATGFFVARLQFMLSLRRLASSNRTCFVASTSSGPMIDLLLLLNANCTQLTGLNSYCLGTRVALADFEQIVRAKSPALCILYFNNQTELRAQFDKLAELPSRVIVLLKESDGPKIENSYQNVEIVEGSIIKMEMA